MVKVRPPNDPAINYIYVCIEEYLDGKQSCDWILNIMKKTNLPKEKLAGIMRQLSDYGSKDRYSELARECRLFGLV